jgi:hypothetical protein
MTFGEIYSAVVLNVWGDSTPPSSMVTRLQGEEGIIANMHRDIQVDYNYWFMKTYYTLNSVDGQQGYALPDNYKEAINCMWQVVDASATYPRFTDPLIRLSVEQAHWKWKDNNSETEYPGYFEIINGQSIIFYPIPSEDNRELTVVYWKFLERPTTAGFTTAYDDLTTAGAEAIVALATAKAFRILQEFNNANMYEGEAKRQIELLKQEDYRRRQANLEFVEYRGI